MASHTNKIKEELATGKGETIKYNTVSQAEFYYFIRPVIILILFIPIPNLSEFKELSYLEPQVAPFNKLFGATGFIIKSYMEPPTFSI